MKTKGKITQLIEEKIKIIKGSPDRYEYLDEVKMVELLESILPKIQEIEENSLESVVESMPNWLEMKKHHNWSFSVWLHNSEWNWKTLYGAIKDYGYIESMWPVQYKEDGDMICATYKDFINLQESIAWFGKDYAEARKDLEKSIIIKKPEYESN